MSRSTRPFAVFEWIIAWRYLRSRRAHGGVSTMTWISLIGITLSVFALIATLAVRSGFRSEFVDTILGANAHITLYKISFSQEFGQMKGKIENYDELVEAITNIPEITRAAPIIKSQVMATTSRDRTGVQVFGIRKKDLKTLPSIMRPASSLGNIESFENGLAIGSGVAQELDVSLGDEIKLISPDGLKTAFGTSPRVKTYQVVYIFKAGRYDIDKTRIYMPFVEAQNYFNRENTADEIEIMIKKPEEVETSINSIKEKIGNDSRLWTWKDSSRNFLRALEIEDNVMFVIMAILVLIASMNIVSGLIMLVKNKGRDIGILRTMGLTDGSIMRIFFLCGAFTGTIGTFAGTSLGCLFAIYADPIFSFINVLSGGDIWDPSIRGIYSIPAELKFNDVVTAISLSLSLSYLITIFPARRAAKLNPIEALRYE